MAEPDEVEGPDESPAAIEAQLGRVLGMFEAPAFARRGADLEQALDAQEKRLAARRDELLAGVRLRLRQWSLCATGPDDGAPELPGPLASLWEAAGAPPPSWASRPAGSGRRRAVARDLRDSVGRFNARWTAALAAVDLGPINRMIDRYNRYYLLEKECLIGSGRVAARLFAPRDPVTAESLLERFPLLPEPGSQS